MNQSQLLEHEEIITKMHINLYIFTLCKLLDNKNNSSLCSPYRQTFREEWLKDPGLSPWIQKFPPDATKAFCPICQMTIGSKHSSLITHAKSGGHERCLKELKTKFRKQCDLNGWSMCIIGFGGKGTKSISSESLI